MSNERVSFRVISPVDAVDPIATFALVHGISMVSSLESEARLSKYGEVLEIQMLYPGCAVCFTEAHAIKRRVCLDPHQKSCDEACLSALVNELEFLWLLSGKQTPDLVEYFLVVDPDDKWRPELVTVQVVGLPCTVDTIEAGLFINELCALVIGLINTHMIAHGDIRMDNLCVSTATGALMLVNWDCAFHLDDDVPMPLKTGLVHRHGYLDMSDKKTLADVDLFAACATCYDMALLGHVSNTHPMLFLQFSVDGDDLEATADAVLALAGKTQSV